MFDWIQTFQQWLIDILLWVPRKLVGYVVDGLLAIVDALPVPDFIANIAGASSSIPSNVWYFAAPLQLTTGFAILVSAYGIRFLIRRIPLVG